MVESSKQEKTSYHSMICSPTGPLLSIIQYLTTIESIELQGLSKKFYDELIPQILDRI